MCSGGNIPSIPPIPPVPRFVDQATLEAKLGAGARSLRRTGYRGTFGPGGGKGITESATIFRRHLVGAT